MTTIHYLEQHRRIASSSPAGGGFKTPASGGPGVLFSPPPRLEDPQSGDPESTGNAVCEDSIPACRPDPEPLTHGILGDQWIADEIRKAKAMTKLKLIDNDAGEVRLDLGVDTVRSWAYSDESERRLKMLLAWEFRDGWYQACDSGQAVAS